MFEALFKYPWTAYRSGHIVFLRDWPLWTLLLASLAAAGLVFYLAWRRRGRFGDLSRSLILGALQFGVLAVLLLMLWQPALSVSSLKSNQNVIAVIVDTSRSMAVSEDGQTRIDRARKLAQEIVPALSKDYPVHIYQTGTSLQRVDSVDGLQPKAAATRLGAALTGVAQEAAVLPVGGIILLSDGADTQGGLTQEQMNLLRTSRIPVHPVGFGREAFSNDIELADVQIPQRALAGGKLAAAVTLRHAGFSDKQVRLTVKDGNRVAGTQTVRLQGDGSARATLRFDAGEAGARLLTISAEPLEGEQRRDNNSLQRMLNVTGKKPRILYFEGEPRWEYKFIRRAAELDSNIEFVSMVRTTQNKLYRQGVSSPKDLEDGFPQTVEELFGYDAIILGSVEAGSFTPTQLNLLKEFVDRRGGGLLLLGARSGLSDGGWQKTPVAETLPLTLPDRKNTFRREPAKPELAQAGRDSLITTLDDSPEKNLARWKSMPPLADTQEVGAAKLGALVLLESSSGGRKQPLLATQFFGRGRTAVLSGGTWHWQMGLDSKDMSHETFWRQLLRWLSSDSGGHVAATPSETLLADDTRVKLRAEVRDTNYLPAPDAEVEARLIGPNGLTDHVALAANPTSPGVFEGEWTAAPAGGYVAEIVATRGGKEIGRESFPFQREDGVAENFHSEQNRELLERLASETGGRYHRPSDASRIADEVKYSSAGFSASETRDLWDLPFFFLLLAALKGSEWFLRRKWGAV